MPNLYRPLLATLIFCTLCTVNTIKFTSHPSSATFTVKDTMWLQFNYDLEGSVMLKYECGIWDRARKAMVVMAQATPKISFAPTIATGHRVKAYPHNNTFAISNLHFRDAGIYYCALTYRFSIFIRRLTSKGATIKIEGKPIACSQPPQRVSKEEGGMFTLTLTYCAAPRPIMNYHFMISQHFTSLPLAQDTTTPYKYKGSVTFRNLKRHHCGRKLEIWGSNSRGESDHKVLLLEVRFKPVQPKITMARFTGEGECVECYWQKQESGACEVKYAVDFLGLNGIVIQSVNSKKYFAKSCHSKILSVRVVAMTSSESASSMLKVSPKPKNATTPERGQEGSQASTVAGGKSTMENEQKKGFNSIMFYGTVAGITAGFIWLVILYIFWRRARRAHKASKKEQVPTTLENLQIQGNTVKGVSPSMYDDCSEVDAGFARYVGLTGRPLPSSPEDPDYQAPVNDPVYMSIMSKNV